MNGSLQHCVSVVRLTASVAENNALDPPFLTVKTEFSHWTTFLRNHSQSYRFRFISGEYATEQVIINFQTPNLDSNVAAPRIKLHVLF